jgi:hypothetical protein
MTVGAEKYGLRCSAFDSEKDMCPNIFFFTFEVLDRRCVINI